MLQIEGLRVEVAGQEILHGIDLHMQPGQTHVLFGPNGSGKTTLLNTIIGLSEYKVTAGTIRFQGRDITALPPTNGPTAAAVSPDDLAALEAAS